MAFPKGGWMTERSDQSASLLLEPKEKSVSDFILPGILGVAGAAILYASFRKKDTKAKLTESKTEVSDNEIKFSSKYSTFSVGKDWVQLTLEPYLLERAEEGDLATASTADDTVFGSIGGAEFTLT